MPRDVSIIIPVNNEEGNIIELCFKLSKVLDPLALDHEVIFVEDGSSDNTYANLLKMHDQDKHVNIIKLRDNFGKSAGLSAGFCYARGKVIITMDGDLQHDPEDIPFFLDKINSGYRLVNGWKKKESDDSLCKRIANSIFKILMRLIFRIRLNNISSGFKAYHIEDIKNITLREGLHRFIPVILKNITSICEIEIKCGRRNSGKSHYSWKKTIDVCRDIVLLLFRRSHVLRNYSIQDKIEIIKFHP